MAEKNNPNQRLAQIPASIWSKITKIDEFKGQWIARAKLSPQALRELF